MLIYKCTETAVKVFYLIFFISTHNHNFDSETYQAFVVIFCCVNVADIHLPASWVPVICVCLLEADNVRYWDDNVMCWNILHPAPGLQGMCSALDNSCDTLTIMQLMSL